MSAQLWPCPRCSAWQPQSNSRCFNCGLQLAHQPANHTMRNVLLAVGGVVLIVLVLAVLVIGPLLASRQARSTQGPPEAAVSLSGDGIGQSRTFSLGGGDYAVDWTATAHTSGGCFHALTLSGSSSAFYSDIVTTDFSDGATHSGTGYIHGVPGGTYYIKADTGCGWTATIHR